MLNEKKKYSLSLLFQVVPTTIVKYDSLMKNLGTGTTKMSLVPQKVMLISFIPYYCRLDHNFEKTKHVVKMRNIRLIMITVVFACGAMDEIQFFLTNSISRIGANTRGGEAKVVLASPKPVIAPSKM